MIQMLTFPFSNVHKLIVSTTLTLWERGAVPQLQDDLNKKQTMSNLSLPHLVLPPKRPGRPASDRQRRPIGASLRPPPPPLPPPASLAFTIVYSLHDLSPLSPSLNGDQAGRAAGAGSCEGGQPGGGRRLDQGS